MGASVQARRPQGVTGMAQVEGLRDCSITSSQALEFTMTGHQSLNPKFSSSLCPAFMMYLVNILVGFSTFSFLIFVNYSVKEKYL